MPDNDKNKVKKSTSNLNSKWLQNTMKSLGVASTKVIRDLMPATSETIGTASKVTANTIKDIRSSRASLRRVQNAFNQTPIAKTAQDFFKNAIDDMKSGDFYKDRTSTGDDSDLSFGDLDNMFGDTSIEGDVNVENTTHIESSAATDAVLTSINKQVEFNVKAAKAQTDTMMSLGSSMILKHNEFSGKLLSEISSIGANVAALVEYQNTNMTKLIDASIGFFEQMVPKEDVSSTDSSKVNAENIFGSGGGLDFENYLQYVKGNIADLKNGSMAGSMISMLLENKDMLFTNPMGMVAEGLIKQVIPAATKTAMQRLDQSVKDFIPVMLERLGTLGEGDNSMFGSFLRGIGGVFGIKRNRKTEFDFSKIKKGPVPYNGMANHTIVEIIPKYLRESTSYLKEIATYFTGKTEAEMNQNALGFDWSSGRFKTIGDMTTELYNQIGSEITGAYQSSDFHKYLMSRRDLLDSDADKENLESALGELELIAEQRGTLKVDSENFNAEVEDMVGNLQLASENIKEFFRAAFADAKERSDEMLGNFIATTQKASRQRNAMIKSMNEGATENGLYQVNAALTKDNIDEKTLEIYRQKHGSTDATISPVGGSGGTGSGGPSPNQGGLPEAPHQSKAELKAKFAERAADDRSYEPTPSGGGIRNEIGDAAARPMNRLSSVLNAIMAGNSDQAFDELMKGVGNIFRKAGNYLTTNFLGPIKKSLFGEKDEQGFLRGGIFEGVQNRLKDASFSLRRIITGKGYVDSTGQEFPDVPEEEKDKTVVGKLSKAVDFFKSSIKERLFGVKNEEGEEGEEKEGIVGKFRRGLSSVSSSLLRGLTGWKHALFGKSDDENEDEEEQGKVIYAQLKEKAKEIAPDAIAGSIGGGILGLMVGGPIGGALLGFAGGILKRSDRFQNWLFGEKDEDGERTGGFISKGVQDYFKKNGKFLTGGAILGGITGTLTGGGLLGTLVGGPLAGAIMGIGSSMLLKSDAFQKFLFGDAENGQLGIVSHIKRWTSNIGRNKETGDPEASKMFGMGAIGVGTGGILGMLVGGPIVGAIAGLGASILAQRNNFKEWLFGSVDKETGAKKEGVLGKFRNMLTVTVLHPIRDGLADIGRRTKTWGKDILGKAAIVFGDIGDGIRNTVHKITGAFGTAIGGVAKSIKENFLDNIIEGARKVFEPLTNIVTMLGKGVAGAARTIIGFPVNLLYKLTSPIAKAVSKGIGTVFGIVGKAVRIALAPVALMIKGVGGILKVAGKVVAAPFKLVSGIFNFFNEKVSALVVHVGGFFSKLGDMVYQKIDDVLLRPIREFGQHIKDAGKAIVERITRPFRMMGDFVKGIFKGIGQEISESIKQSVNRMFSILNPLNWVRALMKGGKSLIGLLTGRKPGEDNQPKKKSWLRQIWDDTKYGYQKDYSEEMVYDDNGNPINTTLSKRQTRRALENRTKIDERKDREKKFNDRNRRKNEKLIYKYTKGQRTQDTEENRKLAEMMSGKVGGIQWKSVDPIKKIEESQLSETQDLHKTVKLIAKFLSGGTITSEEDLKKAAGNLGASMAKVEGKAKDIQTAAKRSGTFDSKDLIQMAERDKKRALDKLGERHSDLIAKVTREKGLGYAMKLEKELWAQEAEERKKIEAEYKEKYDNAMDVVADGQTTWNKATDRIIKKYWDKEGLDLLWRLKGRSRKGLINSVKRLGLMPKDWDPGEESQDATPDEAPAEGYATGTSNARRGFHILGENGPEAGFGGIFGKGRIFALNGPQVKFLTGGEQIIPNDRIEAPSSSEEQREALRRRIEIDRAKDAEITRKERESLDADKKAFLSQFSENTDAEISRVSDTRKLSIGERLIRGLNDIKASYNEAKEIYGEDTDGNEDDSDMSNVERLKKMLKNGIFGVLGMIPGFNLLMNAAIFGKTLVGATGEVIGAGVDKVKGVATGVANRVSTAGRIVSGTITGFRNRQDARDAVQYDDEGNIISTPTEAEAADAKLAPAPVTAGDKLRAALSERKAASAENTDAKLAPLTAGDKLRTTLNARREAMGTVSKSGAIVRDDQMYADQQAAQAAVSGRTAEAERKRREEEEQKERENERADATLAEIKGLHKTEKQHSGMWNSIFSKKGLITGGLLLLGPLLMNFLKNGIGGAIINIANALKDAIQTIIDKIKPFIDKVIQFGKNLGANLIDQWNQTEVGHERENGETVGERAAQNLENLAKGHWFYDENGEVTNQTSPRAKLAARAGLNFALKHPVITATAKTAADDVAKLGGKGLSKVGGKAAQKLGPGTLGLKALDKAGSVKNPLLKKVLEIVGKFFTTISDKLFKFASFGKKSTAIFTKLSQNVTKVVTERWATISSKVSRILGVKAATLNPIGFIANAAFIGFSALNGLSGTAKLFHVKQEAVDGKMKIISTIMGGFSGTLIGSIIEVISALMADITGVDFLSAVAVAAYKFLADDEEAAALDSAQKAFDKEYQNYRLEEIEKQYNTQKAAGLIDANMSLKEFRAATESGEIKVDYKSEDNYNTDVNASLSDKFMKGLGKGIGGLKNFLGGKDTTKYEDQSGKQYIKNADGTFEVYDKLGNDLGYIAEDAVMAMEGLVDKSEHQANILKRAGSLLYKTFIPDTQAAYRNPIDGTWYDYEGNHFSAANEPLGDSVTVEELGVMVDEGILVPDTIITRESVLTLIGHPLKTLREIPKIFGMSGDTMDKFGEWIKDKGGKVIKGIGNIIGGATTGITNFFNTHKEKVFVDPTDGTYYTADGNHYSKSGVLLSVDKPISQAELKIMIDEGALLPAVKELPPNIDTKLSNIGMKMREAWNSGLERMHYLWDHKKEIATAALEKIKTGGANFAKNWIATFSEHTEKRWHSVEGGYYQSNGSLFSYYNDNGDLLQDGITAEEFAEICQSGLVTEEDYEEITVKSRVKVAVKDLREKIGSTFTSVLDKTKKALVKIANSPVGKLMAEVAQHGIFGTIGEALSKTKTGKKVWYTPEGNYYKKNGSTYSMYNMNGDVVKEGITQEEFDALRQSSVLTEEDEIVDNEAKKAIRDIKSAVKGAWNKAKSVVVSGWEKFKNWISSGEGEGSSGGSGIGPAAVAGAYGGSGNGRAIGIGGNGDVPERLNGIPYYSQNDPRWAGNSYNIMGGRNDGATIGDSGCGPAAMSMVVNDMEDKRPTPADMAKLAQRTGDRDETGTNANFISASAKKYGISSYRQLAPSKDTIETGLSTGNPMVLLGKGDVNTPYTEVGHYIVVTGMDKSGNIVYNDPRGVQYSGTMDANSVLNNTQAAWAFRDGGRGTISDKDKPKADSIKISPSNGYTKVVTPGNYLRYSMDGIYHSFGGKGDDTDPQRLTAREEVSAMMDGYEGDVEGSPLMPYRGGGGRGAFIPVNNVGTAMFNPTSAGMGGSGSVAPLNITTTAGLVAKFNWPTGKSTARWGDIRSGGRRHAGVDLHHWAGQVANAPIQSFTSGVVYKTAYPFLKEHKAPNRSEFGQARGNYVVIKDENNVYHIYQHLNPKKYVKEGDTIGVGQVIGAYGNTGHCEGSTGLHLHYEVRPSSDLSSQAYDDNKLAKITYNPKKYLDSYSQGKPYTGDFSEGGVSDSGSESTGQTTAYNTATPSYDGGLITQLTSAFGNISNALLDAAVTGDMNIDWTEVLNRGQAAQQGASLSTSTGSTSSSTSASSNVSLSGNVKSKAEAFRYMYERLHEINVPNNQIAGVLSNFDVENGGDPTSFEAYYLKYPNTGYTEDPKKLSIVGTGDSFPNWDSIDNWTRGVVWPNTKGIYKPGYKSSMPGKMVMGIGIGSWTGIGGEDLLKYAKQTGQPWYNMKTQMDYFTKGESLAKNGLIAFDKKYRTKANMSEWWKGFAAKSMTPTEAANWYFYNAEMPSGSRSQAAQHASKANYWSEQIKSWGGSGFGGRGSVANVTEAPDTLNGIPYYSQNDPRWASNRYKLPNGEDDGSTMSNSGCGPTAMSMVINSMTGGTSPVGMAKLAQETGDRDETGTNWNFIDNAANAYGIDSTRATNPSSDVIKAGLGTGHPMILSGYGSESDSPYTDAGHYIVATGIKGNQLTYNDPRGKAYSGSMDINKVADNTSAAWAFGGGFGAMVNNIINKRNHRMGGRGTNSSLATVKIMSPNKNIGRNHTIDTITIHCMAGNLTAEQCGKTFANPNRDASSNYGVDSNGVIALYVNESDRSWCTSSPSNDNRAITIEVANTQASEPFPISDKAYDALVKLCADICHRNNIPELRWKGDKSLIGQVDKQNMTVHRWFANKSCPGEWLYSHMGQIADDVNKLLGNESHFASYDSAGVADGASASTDTSATVSSTVSSTATTSGYQSFISKTTSAFTNISNALLKGMTTGDLDIDWSGVLSDGKDNSGGVDASASTTSTSESGGTTPTIGKYEESEEGMARGAYDWMKQLGLPDMHIAGMLSNWNHESHLDPSAVEGDYYYFPDEYYKIGPKKQAAFADLNTYTKKVMKLHHTSSSFYQAKTSQGGDNNWYAGIGFPQFTGINAYKLVNYANSIGKPWYSLETQMRYFTEPGKYYDGFKEGTNAIETWKSQNFKTPEEAAAYYYSHWEMPGKTIDNNHRKNASRWYKKAQEWSAGGGSGEGATLQDKRYIIPQAEKEPTTVDNSVTPASVKINPHNERGVHVPQAALYNNTNNFVADNTDVVAILNRMASAIDNINENSNNLSKLDMLSDINSGISEVSVTQINGGSKNVVTTTGKQTQNRPASGTISRSEEKARKIAFGR